MCMTIEYLITKYEGLIEQTINPDGHTCFEDLGFETGYGPEGYESLLEYLEATEDLDEGQQTELRVYREFLEELTTLKGSCGDDEEDDTGW